MTKFNQAFEKMMEEQWEIALATSIGDHPNVRIVNFLFDQETKCLYFSTFIGNEKEKEFQQNDQIAFSTIPKGEGNGHIRVKEGRITKSTKTLFDLEKSFVRKMPFFKKNINQVGNMLVVYEITFDQAQVILDMQNQALISI